MAKPKKPAKKPARPAAKKPAAKKAAAKKPAAKKPAAKKAPAKKPAANKAPAKVDARAKPPAGKRIGINPMTGERIYVDAKGERSKAPAAGAATKTAVIELPATVTLLRGIPLVDTALERRANDQLSGMSADEIAAIDFGGKPMSPSLAHWLARDRDMFTLGPPTSLGEMLEAETGEFAEAFVELGRYLTEPVVLFEGWGSDSRRFLYLGATDEHGEYPVFTIDTDDMPFACLNGPVDVWLAQQAGALDSETFYGQLPPAYEPTRAAFAKACFGGNIAFVDFQFSKTLEG